jgi:hypothetical protein
MTSSTTMGTTTTTTMETSTAAMEASARTRLPAGGKCMRHASMIEAAECAGVHAGRRAAGKSAAMRNSARAAMLESPRGAM